MSYWGKKKKKTTDTHEDNRTPQSTTVKKSVLKKEYSTQVPLEFASEVNLNEDESPWTTYII